MQRSLTKTPTNSWQIITATNVTRNKPFAIISQTSQNISPYTHKCICIYGYKIVHAWENNWEFKKGSGTEQDIIIFHTLEHICHSNKSKKKKKTQWDQEWDIFILFPTFNFLETVMANTEKLPSIGRKEDILDENADPKPRPQRESICFFQNLFFSPCVCSWIKCHSGSIEACLHKLFIIFIYLFYKIIIISTILKATQIKEWQWKGH